MSLATAAPEMLVSYPDIPVGGSVPLNSLLAPGTYVCNRSGSLLRVSRDDPAAGVLHVDQDADDAPWTVTKISENPQAPRSAARALATEFGLKVGF